MSSMIESFDSLARLLLEALLNTLWQGMLITALVWLLLRFIKRLSATTRHAVWLVTLLTIGALPLVGFVANRNLPAQNPAPPIKPEPSRPAGQTVAPIAAPDAIQSAEVYSLDGGVARLDSTSNQGQPKINYDLRPALRFSELRFEDGARAASFEESSSAVAATAAASPKVEGKTLWRRAKAMAARIFSGPAPLLLVFLWLSVCALMSWRVARSYRAVFRLRGGLEAMPSEQRAQVKRLAGLFGIKRRVRAFTSGQIVMPMTVGSLKPLIILPPDLAGDLSQSEFESVVAHELAHIKRWDYLTNMLQRVAQAYLFFHPAVWFISKQLMIERELACDDWAVKTCEPRRYASCLTKLVEALNESKPHMAVRVAATGIGGIIFGKHVISRRVEMILNRDRNATTAVSKPALIYAIGLVVVFVAVCSLIAPVIAVPLGQKPQKQIKKESKAVEPAKSQEFPPLPPVPALPPDAAPVAEPPDIPDIPDLPEAPEAPLPSVAALPPDAELAPLPSVGVIGGIPGGVIALPAPSASPTPLVQIAQGGRPMAITRRPIAGGGPETPPAVPVWAEPGQDERRADPAIPETELVNLLVDIVKRDTDPNVRNEALQGLYRVRTDAGINALIQLYDGVSDVKVRGEIIRYLLRREGGSTKVDNSKAIAKLIAIAKSEQNEELRNRAISYLGNVKGDEGANTLIQIYDTLQDQKMKQYVIRSLAQNRSRKAIDKLIQIAKNDSDPAVRQYAIQRLYAVGNYMDLFDKGPARVGMLDGHFFTPIPTPSPRVAPAPRVFRFNGEPFEFDTKKWEEWQRDWQKNWEEQIEKSRELIEKMRLDGPIRLKIEDLQNRLRIEMPRIELQLKDLEDKIRLGYGFDRINLVESQLGAQLASVESQLAAIRSQYNDTHPKTAEMRNLRNALERQLNSVRSMRTATTRPPGVRSRRAATSATSSATPSATSSDPVKVYSTGPAKAATPVQRTSFGPAKAATTVHTPSF
ncbi:MAG TPA: M56 family metallopeptidase [Blastocatellia bacterium]|nr:M56 family metallopeptidase [Blastocatellia bacterium]